MAAGVYLGRSVLPRYENLRYQRNMPKLGFFIVICKQKGGLEHFMCHQQGRAELGQRKA